MSGVPVHEQSVSADNITVRDELEMGKEQLWERDRVRRKYQYVLHALQMAKQQLRAKRAELKRQWQTISLLVHAGSDKERCLQSERLVEQRQNPEL
jgi:hypothetical protein